MRNLRLDLCYDGTRYRGWQRIPGRSDTIQGKLEDTLQRILGEPVQLIGSGRTDAGVHAAGQAANFHTASVLSEAKILAELRRYLPEDIGIISCKEVPERFHARFSAVSKTYRYRIWNSEAPCVFDRQYVARFPEKLDLSKMEAAGKLLVGSHDFSAFCTNRRMKKSSVREIRSLRLERLDEEIRITVTADGFLYNMMRILAGTLIEVGRGEREIETIPSLFGAQRRDAGFLAPAQGLCLMEVTY